MRPFRRLTIPKHVDPLVIRLFEEMRTQQIGVLDMAEKSGVSHDTLKNWRHHSNPRLPDIRACFDVLGLRLVAAYGAKR